jgi:hypothetical protein
MNEPWVCIGHSHVAALAKALDPDLDCINFWDTGDPWVQRDGDAWLRDDLAKRVASGRLVLSLLGGSAHNVLGAVEHPRPFDFILPSRPDLPLDESRDLVPADAVREKLEEMARPYLDAIPALIRAATAPVIQLEPPPPVADTDLVASRMPWGFYPGQPQIVAPKWVRYKVWRLHCEVIASACARHGAAVAPAPKAPMDSEGFLHPDCNEDGAHANGVYGQLVLQSLRSRGWPAPAVDAPMRRIFDGSSTSRE